MSVYEQAVEFAKQHQHYWALLLIEDNAIAGFEIKGTDAGYPSYWQVRDRSKYDEAVALWRSEQTLTMQECMLWVSRDTFPAEPTIGSSCLI